MNSVIVPVGFHRRFFSGALASREKRRGMRARGSGGDDGDGVGPPPSEAVERLALGTGCRPGGETLAAFAANPALIGRRFPGERQVFGGGGAIAVFFLLQPCIEPVEPRRQLAA